mgnify:CR=1 FL=1
MPSILAGAAMAALAGSGGRKLDGSGGSSITACTHDICGRKLLEYNACTHDICGRKLLAYHGDRHVPTATRGSYGIALDPNTIFAGHDHTKVSVAGDKLVVTTTMKAEYDDAVRQCILTATPTIVDGLGVATTLTSVTFNPAASGGASVSPNSDTLYDAGTNTFVAQLDTPATDGKSLGYIGVDVAIGLECTDFQWYVHETDSAKTRPELLDGTNWADGNPRLKTYGVFTDYNAQTPFQVKYTFKESAATDDQLALLGGVDTGLAASSAFGAGNLQVAVAGTATLKTEDNTLRFPYGEWLAFGQATTSNTILCTVEQTVNNAYSGLSGWYDNAAGAAQGAISYDSGADSDCNTAQTICESRTHSAAISYVTDIGFQIPLAKYFDAQPTIQCADAGASSTETKIVDLDSSTACSGAQCSLGAVAPGLDVSANSQGTTDFGDDIFLTFLSKPVTTFYDVAQSVDTAAWIDLDDTFDYRISVQSSGGTELTAAADGAGESGQIAALAGDIAGVQGALTTALGVAKTKEIARPVVYGETRSDYALSYKDAGLAAGSASKTIALRRSSDGISVAVSQAVAGDGAVVYGGGSAIGAPTNFDGPGLAWRTNLGDASVTNGASTAASADVRATITANDLIFFKDQASVTDAVLFDQISDADGFPCAKDYCQSPDGGTKWRCSAQSATFSLEVGKLSTDDREAQTVNITKDYSVDAQESTDADGNVLGTDPALPAIAGSSTVVYKIAGTIPDATHSLTASSTDTGDTNALNFGVKAAQAGARAFDCSAQASLTVDYEADFRQTCGARTAQPIAYSEPYAMVYSADQVTPSAAVSTTAQFSEYVLQRVGQDITFTVSPSQVGYGLPFQESTLRVAVKYGGAPKGDATCTVGLDGVAACTLTGFQDENYDSGHALAHDQTCGDVDVSGSIEGNEFACPQLTLNIYETFAIPDVAISGDLATMFKPSSVATGAVCGAPVPHLIGTRTIDVSVDGSETTFDNQIEFFNNGETTAFATLAADASGKAAGATSEYATEIAVPRDTTTLATSNLNGNLADLQLKLTFATAGMSGLHTVKNLGGSNYEIYKCPNNGDWTSCAPDDQGDGSVLNTGWSSMPGGLSMTVLVRKTDGGDPCDGKILGAPAYDGGIKFSVQKLDEQAHEYTLPILCHVERNVEVASQAPSQSNDAWNDKFLDVTLTGSAIDYRKFISLTGDSLGNALRTGAEQSVLSALIARQAAGSGDALTARLTLDYKENCDATGLKGQLKWDDEVINEGNDPAEHALACPSNELGMEVGGVAISSGALITASSVASGEFKTFGDVFMIDMVMTGRDSELHGTQEIAVAAVGSDETVEFLSGATQAINDKQDGGESTEVYFRVGARASGKIECSFLTITLSSKTTLSGDSKDFSFKIQCPRQNSGTAASDDVKLEYGVSALNFGHTSSSVTLPNDPTGFTSSIFLGSCSETNVATPGDNDATNGICGLTAGLNTWTESATVVLNKFASCGGSTNWANNGFITSTVNVARSYVHADDNFDDSKFCSATPLHISVQKDATKTVTIAVSANLDMDFDVHVAAAGWDGSECTGADAGKYKLVTTINMLRNLNGVAWTADGIESYERTSINNNINNKFSAFKKSDGTPLTDGFQNGGSTLVAETACIVPDATEHQVSFTMNVLLGGVDYFSAASVTMSVSAPDSDDADYDSANMVAFQGSLSVTDKCAATDSAITTACSNKNTIAANNNVQLALVIGTDELAAFDHIISDPQISVDDKTLDDAACTMHVSCTTISDVTKVPLATYQASDDDGAVAIVSTDKQTVTLKALPFANSGSVVIGWTVTRTSSGRRLRSVEHVTYALGADGSVSKSSSFAVLPAVRDSDDASAVTTKEQITLEELDADGNIVYSEVYNQTTVEYEKSGEDHTLAVLGIVFGGLGSAAAIAVAFFVGCASRKDAQGVGSSFKTVAGGFSDRRPLFNRNRFAPSDF